MNRVSVAVRACDPIALAGVVSHLQAQPEVLVLPNHHRDESEVQVFAVNTVDNDVVTAVRAAASESPAAMVLVAGKVATANLSALTEARVSALLPREAITDSRLVTSIVAAASGRVTSLRDLDAQAEVIRRSAGALDPTSISEREADILRLMAEGWDTVEIAGKLCYSERTVKNIIYTMTSRLNLRNRPHAVAFAVRAGVI